MQQIGYQVGWDHWETLGSAVTNIIRTVARSECRTVKSFRDSANNKDDHAYTDYS